MEGIVVWGSCYTANKKSFVYKHNLSIFSGLRMNTTYGNPQKKTSYNNVKNK